MSELARGLEAARRAKKHSQTRAAAALEISQSLLSLLVRDLTPLTEDHWPAFAAYLDVDEDEIRRLAEDADAERVQAVSKPDLEARVAKLEDTVAKIGANVALIGAEQASVRGMVEMMGTILGANLTKAPAPRRRAPARRAK